MGSEEHLKIEKDKVLCVTPFSINDILNRDTSSEMQEAALDMSRPQDRCSRGEFADFWNIWFAYKKKTKIQL